MCVQHMSPRINLPSCFPNKVKNLCKWIHMFKLHELVVLTFVGGIVAEAVLKTFRDCGA